MRTSALYRIAARGFLQRELLQAAGRLPKVGQAGKGGLRRRGRPAPVVQCAGTVMKPIFWMPAVRAADMISASFW